MIKNSMINRIRNTSAVKKATLAYFISNLLIKGIAILSGTIFTRIMTEEQYGLVSTYQSWQSVLTIIITLNLAQGVFNNGMLDFKEDRDGFVGALITISSVSSLIYMVIYAIFQKPINLFLELDSRFVWLILISCFFTPAYNYWNGRQRYELKYKLISFLAVIASFFSVVIGIILVVCGNENDAGFNRIIGVEGISIILGFIIFSIEGIRNRLRINWKYVVYALKFNIPLIPHYVSMYVLSSSDRIMITKMVSMDKTAIYSVAYSVFSIVFIFWSSLEAALSPWIYDKLSKNDIVSVRNISYKLLIIYGMIGIIIVLFAPEMMFILAPSTYQEGIYIIPSVAISAFFMAVFSLYIRVELFYKRTKFSAIATGISALLNVILNIFGIRMYGYIAAGYTTLFCYALLTIMHYLFIKKNGYARVYNNSGIFRISIILVGFSVVSTVTYGMTLVRYVLIAIIVLLIVVKKKQVASVIKQFIGRKES